MKKFIILIIVMLLISTGINSQQLRKIITIKLPDLKVSIRPDPLSRISPIPVSQVNKLKLEVLNQGKREAKNFNVEVILSSDAHIPVKNATESVNFKEDMQLKGGSFTVSQLTPGAKWQQVFYVKHRLPDNIPPGEYYIGAVVDVDKKVPESNENNNTASFKMKVPNVYIKNGYQGTNATSGPNKYIEVELQGGGFGDTPGNKYLKFGKHAIKTPYGHWSNNLIVRPINLKLVNYGQKYRVYVARENRIGTEIKLSNAVYVTPYMLIYQVVPKEGRPGSLFSLEHFSIVTMGFFGDTQGSKKLMVGNKAAKVVSWSQEKITAHVPMLLPGNYNIYIMDGLKRVSQERSFKVKQKLTLRESNKTLKLKKE